MKKMYIESNHGGNFIMVNEDGKWYVDQCCNSNGFWDSIQIKTEDGDVYLFHASNCTLINRD